MAQMIRKQVYILPAQEARLKRMAEQTGESEAEIIRQALDRQLASHSPRRNLRVWEEEKAFLEELMARGPISGGRSWTREELHER